MALKLKDIFDLYEGVLIKEDSNDDCKSAPDALKKIRDAYTSVSQNEDNVIIDYNEANNRYAYIYYFAVCHTYAVTRQAARILLGSRSTYRDLMGYDKEELNMCSLGGGPGCDLIGLLRIRAAVGLGVTEKINCTVVDICSGWSKSLKNVLSVFLNSSQGKIYQKKLKFELIRSNLLNENLRLPTLNRVATADILTLVKFVSAVPTENTSDILELIFNRLKPGAYVLFLDNARRSTYNRVESAATKAGLSVVCPEMQFNNATEEEILSIGPFKMNTKPLKSTSIRSALWRKV